MSRASVCSPMLSPLITRQGGLGGPLVANMADRPLLLGPAPLELACRLALLAVVAQLVAVPGDRADCRGRLRERLLDGRQRGVVGLALPERGYGDVADPAGLLVPLGLLGRWHTASCCSCHL